jgi:putative hemolysin
VVGCVPILTDSDARRIGGFFAESQFDLSQLVRLPGRLIEVGRICIAPEYREGPAIAVLCSGLAGFIALRGYDYLFGCAGVPLGDGDMQAAAIMSRIRRQAMAGSEVRVTPRLPLRCPTVADEVPAAAAPTLLNAYVRIGARACGEPCRDPELAVAQVPMLLRAVQLHPIYSEHFLDRVAGT